MQGNYLNNQGIHFNSISWSTLQFLQAAWLSVATQEKLKEPQLCNSQY